MCWSSKIDPAQYTLVGAPLAGPLALVKDARFRYKPGGREERAIIYTFSSSGLPISSVAWDRRIVGMGWSNKDQLVVVVDSGDVKILNVRCDIDFSCSLGEVFALETASDCFVWPGGVVARTGGSYVFHVLTNFDSPRIEALPSLGISKPPRCFCAANVQVDYRTTATRVVVSTGEGPLLVLQEGKWNECVLNIGAVEKMALSHDGRALAAFTDRSELAIGSMESLKGFRVLDKLEVLPLDMMWCGEEAILVFISNSLRLYNISGACIEYNYDGYEEGLRLVPDPDGVRIFTAETCEFLHKVPKSTESIFSIGSVEPAATLHDATEAFETKNAKADEIMRSISSASSLSAAIYSCVRC
jgi:hypothetical protein